MGNEDVKKAYIYDIARELNNLDNKNNYLRKVINSIDTEFYFSTLNVLFEVIDRKQKEIDELEESKEE